MIVGHQGRLEALAATVPSCIFATVSGAHLYGFESPDSDVDLRGAFVHPLRSQLGLRRPRETHDKMLHEDGLELDFVAHDVRKCVRLAATGSGEVLEQICSPLVVLSTPWHDELRALADGCITRQLHRHYSGFFASRRKLLAAPDATVKHLLYAYRAALSGIVALRAGRIDANLPSLLTERPVDGVADLTERKRRGAEKGALDAGEIEQHMPLLRALDCELDRARAHCSLPEAPTHHRALDDFLVRVREAHR
ncbi:MAG: nucleotidyltransferase domain-containing protein [Planctomycetota bacterium]